MFIKKTVGRDVGGNIYTIHSNRAAKIETPYSEILTRCAAIARFAGKRISDIETIISIHLLYTLTKIAASYSTFYCVAIKKRHN